MAPKIKRRRRLKDAAPSQGRARRAFIRGQLHGRVSDADLLSLASWPGWPPHKQDVLDVLLAVEQGFAWPQGVARFDPVTTPARQAAPLFAPLADVLTHMSRRSPQGQLLASSLSDEAAQDLWGMILRRAQELSAMREHPVWEDPAALDPWARFELLSIIVAEGMTYTRGWRGQDLDFAMERPGGWLQGLELFMISMMKVLTTDLRSIAWLARQPFRRGFTGMCRHYSLLLQVLYEASSRALGRADEPTGVVTIQGTHQFLTSYDHAWTWFVDPAHGRIVPVDLTGADWLYDRKMASSIFNRGFDAQRFNNVSAFVMTALTPMLHPGEPVCPLHAARVEALLALLLNPLTTYGQALLLNLTRQNVFPDDARARILTALRQHQELALWLDELTSQPVSAPMRAARRASAPAQLYERLLDRIGL